MTEPKPNDAVARLLMLIGQVREIAKDPNQYIDKRVLLQRLEAIYGELVK